VNDTDLILATDLEEFETPLEVKEVKPMVMSVQKHVVAELIALKGYTVTQASEETGIPISAIKRWKKHPDFAKLVRDMILEKVDDMRAYRLGLCMQMIESRVRKVEELGDYSMLSSKDTLDIMDSMRKDSEKRDESEQSQYMKTIEALLVKSSKPVVVQIEGGTKGD